MDARSAEPYDAVSNAWRDYLIERVSTGRRLIRRSARLFIEARAPFVYWSRLTIERVLTFRFDFSVG